MRVASETALIWSRIAINIAVVGFLVILCVATVRDRWMVPIMVAGSDVPSDFTVTLQGGDRLNPIEIEHSP